MEMKAKKRQEMKLEKKKCRYGITLAELVECPGQKVKEIVVFVMVSSPAQDKFADQGRTDKAFVVRAKCRKRVKKFSFINAQ